MKRKILSAVTILLLALLLSHYACLLTDSRKQEASKNKLIAAHIYDSINSTVAKPIAISQDMACNTLLKKALKEETLEDASQTEQLMKDYLSSIQKKFGYTVAFVISEKTHRYYSPSGIEKIVNPQEQPYDIWYQQFLDSGKQMNLDTDRDQVNNFRWTVFIDTRITDENGRTLGVVGLGLFMDELQQIVQAAEDTYGVKINLIDADGLVQVDTDTSNIENAYISDAIADRPNSEDFTYIQRKMGGFRMARYLPDLEWYLVIQSFAIKNRQIGIKISFAISFILLVMLFVINVLTKPKKNLATHNDLVKLTAPEDPLTGLPNRNYLRESYGEQGVFNTVRYKTLAMFDIDHFKTITETRNGDDILKEIVKLSKKLVNEQEFMFRWSGDEFVFFLESDVQTCEENFKNLCASIKEKLDVTISVGLVEIDLATSIKTNYHRAVQQCYIVKEHGGNGVCRKE